MTVLNKAPVYVNPSVIYPAVSVNLNHPLNVAIFANYAPNGGIVYVKTTETSSNPV